jgi:two-component system NarL family response regulator
MHVQNILEKLGAADRTHAVTLAIERGILHLDF